MEVSYTDVDEDCNLNSCQEEMEVENAKCNQNLSHDTSGTLVSSGDPEETEEENEKTQSCVNVDESKESASENESQDSTSSTATEGSPQRQRNRSSPSAGGEVVRYVKVRMAPYKPGSSTVHQPETRLMKATSRYKIKPRKPRPSSNASTHNADTGQHSETWYTSSSQGSSRIYRVSGRFELPGDTDDEAYEKNQLEHKSPTEDLHDKRKIKALKLIFGPQMDYRVQNRTGESEVELSEVACDQSQPSSQRDEDCGAVGFSYDVSSGATNFGYEEQSPKTDNETDEFGDTETESEEGVDYDKKNDYNDYAYNIDELEESDCE